MKYMNKNVPTKDFFDVELEKLITVERELIYENMKLDFNPFPVTGIAREETLFPPIREQVRDHVIEYIRSTYKLQEYGGLAIIGDYGMGKSHILRYLNEKINKILGRKAENPVIAVYIDNPGMNARRLVQSILENIGLDELRKYLGIMILDQFESNFHREGERFLKKFLPRQLPLLDKKSFESLMTEPNRSTFFAFLDEYKKRGYDLKKMQNFVRKTIFENMIQDTVAAEQFTSLLFGDEFSIYRSWESITGDLKTRQSSEKSQRQFFRGVIKILKEQGYVHLYVMLDEFEDITISRRISKPKAAEYLSMIRLFVDEHIPEISIVLGTAPKGWEQVKKQLPALASRFREIRLTPLSAEQMKKIMINYLNLARAEKSKFSKFKGSITPFSEHTLKTLVKACGGNIRSLLMTCHRLIEYAAEKKATAIDNKLLNKFNEERMPHLKVK